MRTVVARDVDEHAHNLTDWQQHYDQLAPGHFEGVIAEWQGCGLQIFREGTSRAIRQSCQVWPDAFWFGIEARPSGMRINGRQVTPELMMTRPGGCDFELLTPDHHEIFGIVVQRDALIASAAQLGCQVDWDALGSAELIKAGADGLDECRRSIDQLLHLAGARPGAADALHLQQQAVLVSLLALLDGGDIETAASASFLRRRRIVNDARAHALQLQDQPVSVPMLCEALHVSRRTLQYCFEDVLGISPMTYLRSVRLNGVRRALHDSARNAHGPAAIGDLAAAWGFGNFSQFSCDYKKLFGETPSATLVGHKLRH
ncbi:helix-turn-helix domain-containing protein [Herbaspirillum seropedicae]|nr:helix-turn-helix domain-containing protein [Herbaspirillum sp. alder98]